jgi:hypothetical protein
MKEVWKAIKGFENIYNISNYGRIKSLIRKGRTNELIMKQVAGKYGYMVVCLHDKNKNQKNINVGREVLKAFCPIKKFLQCNHINANKKDNNITNLEWLTPKQNCQHARKLKIQKIPRGEELSKYTKVQVIKIKKMYKTIKSLSYISKETNVGKGTVFNIVHNKTWRHIQ